MRCMFSLGLGVHVCVCERERERERERDIIKAIGLHYFIIYVYFAHDCKSNVLCLH